jgi:hypothetical protein
LARNATSRLRRRVANMLDAATRGGAYNNAEPEESNETDHQGRTAPLRRNGMGGAIGGGFRRAAPSTWGVLPALDPGEGTLPTGRSVVPTISQGQWSLRGLRVRVSESPSLRFALPDIAGRERCAPVPDADDSHSVPKGKFQCNRLAGSLRRDRMAQGPPLAQD